MPPEEATEAGVDADEEGEEYKEALDDTSVAELPLLTPLSYRQLDDDDEEGDEKSFLS